MLVDDEENTVKRTNRVHQQPFIPYKKTSKSYGKAVERNVETSNSYRKLNDLEDEERFTVIYVILLLTHWKMSRQIRL